MIWNKKLIKFDVAFMRTALQNTEPLKSIYAGVRRINVAKESIVLPKYLKINQVSDGKGNFCNEYLFGYIDGTLTMVYKAVKQGVPIECQIPYSEWCDYSYFVVCEAVKEKKKKTINLIVYERYED